MKKLILVFLSVSLAVSVLSGCQKRSEPEDSSSLSIVTTIFPEYDWVMNVLGEKADDAQVTLLLDSGVDLHSFQPSADDIIKIATCDLFIYVGGESDQWVDDALKEAVNQNMVVLDLMDVLGDRVKEEEIKEGMESEEAAEEEEETEYDEHVWLSLKNAELLVDAIEKAISSIDPSNADLYAENAASYIARLLELDERYQQTIEAASVKTILFGDRFPFRYLTDDYGLDYYAAFVGCSAESEASFETIAFLAGKTDELQLSTVLTLEGTDHRLAESIISAASNQDVVIRSLNSMQSVTAEDIKNGVNYLNIMENNLTVLSQSLK